MGSDIQDLIGRKISQESPVPSGIDKADSLADLQQSTEKDFSFISQTESKVNTKYLFVEFNRQKLEKFELFDSVVNIQRSKCSQFYFNFLS